MTESEIDREMSAIIGRMVGSKELPGDTNRLRDLQMRRAKMMQPDRSRHQ